jgi:hypothetical protein
MTFIRRKTGVAVPVVLGLLTGAGIAHAGEVTVTYDPNAQENNFGDPGPSSDTVAYTIDFSENAAGIYGTITERSDLGGTYNPGLLFANLYFGTGATASVTSDFGIEITNDRAFVPGVSGYFSLAGTGFSFTENATTGVITFSLPWTFLETDPLGMGFSTVSAADPDVMLRLSQSLGYSVAGGVANFGSDDLGLVSLPGPIPEPGSLALLGIGFAGAWACRRRRTAT